MIINERCMYLKRILKSFSFILLVVMIVAAFLTGCDLIYNKEPVTLYATNPEVMK